MKKSLSAIVLCIAMQASAQTTFPTIEYVDINNISASVLVHGDLWRNSDTASDFLPDCFFPKGTNKNINLAGTLWMSALDASSNLHVAAQTYRIDHDVEYWPGPLDAADTLTYATSAMWAKIWKVNRTDIQYFQNQATHTIANTPAVILTWPGKGNVNAQGAAGIAITVTNDMAPFVDLNSNGIYEPLLGEYPDVPGDQALWSVFSDNGPTHSLTHGRPLGVEIHAMAYAYNRGTLIDNVIYYDYQIVNRSTNTYHDFRTGVWDDFNLGYNLDDYIGFDSVHRMGIGYNGTNEDGLHGGYPSGSYGTQMPMMGITMIELPGDAGTSYMPAGSFIYYNNDASITGYPGSDTQVNFYLHAQYSSVQHITNSFHGPGASCTPLSTDPNTNYVFPGDPADHSTWSECNCNDNPGDRRFILAGNDFNLLPGGTAHMVMALVTTNLDSNNGCPVAGFDSIKVVADTAWAIYHNPLQPLRTAQLTNNNTINIYPNPAHDKLYITHTDTNATEGDLVIYNTLGQKIMVPVSAGGQKTELDISSLPPGLYNIIYNIGGAQVSKKFIKE